MISKIAVFFPGVGYNKSMPLLYYSAKLARVNDYKVKTLEFSGFPMKLKGDREAMMSSFSMAVAQAETQLRFIDFPAYDDVVFVSKSIGTVAAAIYAKKHNVAARQIYFTPLEQTFSLVEDGNGLVYYGTADTWVNSDVVTEGCREHDLVLHTIEDVGHSLEHDDILSSLKDMEEIMKELETFFTLKHEE